MPGPGSTVTSVRPDGRGSAVGSGGGGSEPQSTVSRTRKCLSLTPATPAARQRLPAAVVTQTSLAPRTASVEVATRAPVTTAPEKTATLPFGCVPSTRTTDASGGGGAS